MSGSASGRGGRGRKRGRSQRQAARDFHPNAAATRYVHEQIKAADTSLPDFSAMTRRKTKLVGKVPCGGAPKLLLVCAGAPLGLNFCRSAARPSVMESASFCCP